MSIYKIEPAGDHLLDEMKQAPSFSANVMSLETALDWAKLIIETSGGNTELRFLKITKEKQLVAIAQVMLVKKLETYDYLWQPLALMIKSVGFLRGTFPKLNIAFLEIPIANYSGLFTVHTISLAEKKLIYLELADYLRQQPDIHALCIKEHNPKLSLDDKRRFSTLAFLPNTELELKQADFAEFVKALPGKRRRKLLIDQRALSAANAHIEICEGSSALSAGLYRLYKKTAEKKTDESNYLRVPVTIHQSFFERFFMYEHLKPRALLVKIEGRLIAYCLLMQSNNTVFFKSVGLDYADSYTSKAYFNLIYATIDYALRQGCSRVDFGVTSYCFKKRIGSRLIPSNYYVEFYRPGLHFFRKPLLYFLKLRFGGVEESA